MIDHHAWNLRPVAREEVRIGLMEDGAHVAAALHVTGPEPGTLYWTKIALADLPNDQVSIDDLAANGIILEWALGAATPVAFRNRDAKRRPDRATAEAHP